MKRSLAGVLLLSLALPGTSDAQAQAAGPGIGRPTRGYANPSAVVAAELAFARLAQEQGQWTAYRETAAADAVMFTPAMVMAQQWLKNRADPPVPLAWQPHRIWASCDGSLMISTGSWRRGDAHGWFTTVWQRQEKGGYQWVLGHRGPTEDPISAPDMIAAQIADCPERRGAGSSPPANPRQRPVPPPVPFDPLQREGRSRDGTLTWQVTVDAAGTREFTARLRKDGAMQEFRSERVAGG